MTPTIEMWTGTFGVPTAVEHAPYHQVFQQLVDPESLLRRNSTGVNVLLVALGDWCERAAHRPAAVVIERLQRSLAELEIALGTATRASAVPFVVVVCPSRHAGDPTELVAALDGIGQRLAQSLDALPGVRATSFHDFERRYPVAHRFDDLGQRIGHAPYTEDYFAVIGTVVARAIYGLLKAPHKVIVLDCDDTLWAGVVGEDGAREVRVDPPRAALQRAMLDLQRRGMVLALCSKNAEADVLEVLDAHPDMTLRRAHFVDWRINWLPKSHNVAELLRALGVGQDAAIFIDNNPVECAEVAAGCPGVLALHIPQDDSLPRFLDHVWALDGGRPTAEDGARTRMYQDEVARRRVHDQAISMADFVAGLELRVRISPLADHNLVRAAQLTQRTNQLNLTTIRRDEAALRQLVASGAECMVAEVSDRFGDYGLVGVTIARVRGDVLAVDTLLLSCRALGRGVEHQLLAALGNRAAEHGLGALVLPFRATSRNQPARAFLEQLGAALDAREADGTDVFRITTAAARDARPAAHAEVPTASSLPELASPSSAVGRAELSPALVHRIARDLDNIPAIRRAVDAFHHKPGAAPIGETSILARTCRLVADALGIPATPDDSYLDLGGDSLLAITVLSRIATQLGVELELRDLFEAADLRELAARIEAGVATRASAELDRAAELELTALVDNWTDAEVTDALAIWSLVALVPAALATSELTGLRRDLVARLVAQHRIDAHVAQPLARRAASTCDATLTQQLMWNLHELGADLQLGMPRAYVIRGQLDSGALRDALVALVARQPALRTVLTSDRGRLVQTVREHGPVLEVVDLTACDDGAVRARFDAFAAVRHDLSRQPFRVELVRRSEREHLLFIAAHHIVVDGFAYRALWTDLPALYRAAVIGTAPEMPPLALAFGDFAFWQTTLEQRPVGQRALAFWARAIAGYAELELPGDRLTTPRAPASQLEAYPAGQLPFVLDGATWTGLTALCSRLNVAPYSAVATMFFVFLTRASGHDEACAMSSSHHRTRPGVAEVIGNFVTPYPLRIAFDRGATLEAAVAHVDRAVLAHRAHHNVGPRSALAGWSEVTRYNLNYLNAPRDAVATTLGDATVELLWQPEPRDTIHDVMLYLRQHDSGIRGKLVYNANRFSPERAGEIAARLAEIARAIATESTTEVGAIAGLS